MFYYLHVTLFFYCLNGSIVGSFRTTYTDFYLESIQVVSENSKFPFASINATIRRNKRDHPRVFFELDVTDYLRNYEGEGKLFYSPMGNRRFMLLPYKSKRQPICELFETDLSKEFNRLLHTSSTNLPKIEDDVDTCDTFIPGHYFVHNFSLDPLFFPKITPTGRFRLVVLIYEKAKKTVLYRVDFLVTFT